MCEAFKFICEFSNSRIYVSYMMITFQILVYDDDHIL